MIQIDNQIFKSQNPSKLHQLLVNIEVELVDVEEDQEVPVPVPEPKQRPKLQPPSLQRLEQDSVLLPELSGIKVALTVWPPSLNEFDEDTWQTTTSDSGGELAEIDTLGRPWGTGASRTTDDEPDKDDGRRIGRGRRRSRETGRRRRRRGRGGVEGKRKDVMVFFFFFGVFTVQLIIIN